MLSHNFALQFCLNDEFPYFDCAEKLAAANMAASTSTLSWESRLWRILWWAFFLSGMMEAKLPSILNRGHNGEIVLSLGKMERGVSWQACITHVLWDCTVVQPYGTNPVASSIMYTFVPFSRHIITSAWWLWPQGHCYGWPKTPFWRIRPRWGFSPSVSRSVELLSAHRGAESCSWNRRKHI